MKPFSILLSLVLGVASLSLVVWIGRFGASVPRTSGDAADKAKAAPVVDDLPMPASGPFGKVEIAETEFNFGAKNVGDKDQHVFTIKNTGEGILEFKLGKPTCQCTIGSITKDGEKIEEGPLAKGESVDITVNWVMKTQLEKFRQVVPVFTTDPDRRTIDLVVTGMVDDPLHISPEGVWDLGEMSPSQPAKAEGIIASTVLDEFNLVEEPRENSKVKVTWEPASESILKAHNGKFGQRIMVEVDPSIPIGPFREVVRFRVIPKEGELHAEIIVVGRRGGPIEVKGVTGASWNPDRNKLLLGDFPAATGKKVKLMFIVKDLDKELVLQSIAPDNARAKVTFPEAGKPFGKSRSYQVEVEIPPGAPGNHHMDKAEVLELKFNHPAAPDFKLTVDYHAT